LSKYFTFGFLLTADADFTEPAERFFEVGDRLLHVTAWADWWPEHMYGDDWISTGVWVRHVASFRREYKTGQGVRYVCNATDRAFES